MRFVNFSYYIAQNYCLTSWDVLGEEEVADRNNNNLGGSLIVLAQVVREILFGLYQLGAPRCHASDHEWTCCMQANPPGFHALSLKRSQIHIALVFAR